jgi:hypothetical protein
MSDIQGMDGRDSNGRFQPGNPGGPGRPRRAIEQDYLAVLSEAVPLERWRTIVNRAATEAEQGNARAREFLAGYLVGRPREDGLLKLAAREAAGTDPVTAAAEEETFGLLLSSVFTPLKAAGT